MLKAKTGDAVGRGADKRTNNGCLSGRHVDERDVADARLAFGWVDGSASIVHVHLDRGVGRWVLPRVAGDVSEPEMHGDSA